MLFANSIQLSLRELDHLAEESHNPKLTRDEVELLEKVNNGDVEGTKTLLHNASENINVNCKGKHDGKSTTPLQIAAKNNDFYMVNLLFENGATHLDKPFVIDGQTEDITSDESRLDTYQALCSPSYICLAYDDPIIAAMDLSAELRTLSKSRDIVDTSKAEYVTLKLQTNKFVVHLLECCQSSEEVKTLLMGNQAGKKSKQRLPVLSKAIETKQMQFVAHRKCHRIARDEWLRGQPRWHRRDGFGWTLLYHIYCFFIYLCFLPFLAIIYVIVPCSPVRYVLDTPKAKFIMQILSYLLFLISQLVMNIHFDFTAKDPRQIFLTYAILIHSIALLWTEILRMSHGMKMYMADLWNYLHLVAIFSAMVDTALRPINDHVCLSASFIAYWNSSTGLFLTLSSLRLLHYLFLNIYLGPMLMLFVAMIWDVFKFIIIFAYTVLCFAIGFFYLYYKNVEQFSNMDVSIMTLMTMIFGSDPSTSIINVNLPDSVSQDCDAHFDGNIYFKIFGYTLYVTFGLLALVILLNICIAMMSDTYSRLQQDIDIYWKFFRTTVWLEYMQDDTPVLPAPYNIIPSVSCLKYLWSRCSHNHSDTIRNDIEMVISGETDSSNNKRKDLSYTELTKILMCRYLLKEKITEGPTQRSDKESDTSQTGDVHGHGTWF